MPHDRDQFAPRPMDAARMTQLLEHQRRYADAPEPLPHNWRDEIALDFSECPHTTSTLIEVEGPHGIWGVLICVNCGTAHTKECAHVRCDWVFDGQLLVCANCGVDGT